VNFRFRIGTDAFGDTRDGWFIDDFQVAGCVPGCNAVSQGSAVDAGPALYEACEQLTLGPDYLAEPGASTRVSGGLSVELVPQFLIQTGATLEVQVCGQSLCQESPDPMPDGCHSCVTEICAQDPFCCDTAFDGICVDEVSSICGLACEAQP
jgi:hypothetical protein